jgi:hypothetical protein
MRGTPAAPSSASVASPSDRTIPFRAGDAIRRWFASFGTDEPLHWTHILAVLLVWRIALQIVTFAVAAHHGVDPNVDAAVWHWSFREWFKWDGGWYVRIAQSGYGGRTPFGQAPFAFFPLYPLAINALTHAGFEPAMAGFLISHVATFFAALFFFRFVERRWDETTARRALIFLLLFPTSFFLVALYAESLLLLLMVLAIDFAFRDRWLAASIAAAFATATKATALVLIPILVLIYLRRAKPGVTSALSLAIAPLGAVAYSAFLGVRFHRPLAWLTSEHAWGRHFGLHGFHHLLTANAWDGRGVYLVQRPGDPIAFLVVIAIAVALIAQRRYELGALAASVVSLPAFSGTLDSIDRYALIAFPIFAWLGAHRSIKTLAAYAGVAAPALVALLSLFLHNHWAG